MNGFYMSYFKGGLLLEKSSGKCLDVEREVPNRSRQWKIVYAKCDPNKRTQQWVFEHYYDINGNPR